MPRRKGVPFARKDQLKTRKNVSLTQKAIAGLVVWYQRLGFPSLSHMLEALGRNELFLLKADSPEVTFGTLLRGMDLEQLASSSSLSAERLRAIADGALPSESELAELSRALSTDINYLMELRRRKFPESTQ
jgi:hypothetical protein